MVQAPSAARSSFTSAGDEAIHIDLVPNELN